MPTNPPETVHVGERRVSCDGGGPLGHPRVFLEMGPKNRVECPYCDRLFVLRARESEKLPSDRAAAKQGP